MDRVANPYTPNAGAMPHALVGRDSLLEDFRILVARVAIGADEKGFIITGLRGVGKTVLLSRFREIAEEKDAIVISDEIAKAGPAFAPRFASLCRRALLEISPRARWGDRAARAARVIKSFSIKVEPTGAVSFGLDVEPQEGKGDSGILASDVADVIIALGEAAQESQAVVVFLLDEIQYLDSEELGALVIAKHQVNQRRLPIVLSGAGLPQLPALTGEAQTYAERMFTFPELDALDEPLATEALLAPARALGVEYEPEAANFIVSYTEGYPYFIQEYGKAVWNLAAGSPITLDDAKSAKAVVEEVLDQDFFAVRVGSLPDSERKLVRALAGLGPGEQRPQDVAGAMGKGSSSSIGSATARLIEKGLVYRSRRGQIAFTVPHFDRYVERAL